jgi:hypothetical protein
MTRGAARRSVRHDENVFKRWSFLCCLNCKKQNTFSKETCCFQTVVGSLLILPRQARAWSNMETNFGFRFLVSSKCFLICICMNRLLRLRRLHWQGEKTHIFFSHLHLKTIILPRQARDKHRESTRNATTALARWKMWRSG